MKNILIALLLCAACCAQNSQNNFPGSGGSTGTGTVTNGANLTQGEPTFGTGTVGILATGSTILASAFPAATADLQIKAALAAAISRGTNNVTVDLYGNQTLAASPFTGNSAFHGKITIKPGATYTCNVSVCWPQPKLTWTDFEISNTGAGALSQIGGSSFVAGTGATVLFCEGSTDGINCPAAGGSQVQYSFISNPTANGNGLQGIILYQNYVGEEGSGFYNAAGFGYAFSGVCMDIGGGGGTAFNSTFWGTNCNNSSNPTNQFSTATAVGLRLNAGAAGYHGRIMGDVSVTNGCAAGGGSCADNGAGTLCFPATVNHCFKPNDNVQICGQGGELHAYHLETFARAGINLGLCTLAGVDTGIATSGVEIHGLTCNGNGSGGCVVIQPNATAAVTNIGLYNIDGELNSGNPINDQNNTAIAGSAHQKVNAYLTGDSGQVILDSSGVNGSAIIVNNLSLPVGVIGTSHPGGVLFVNGSSQVASGATLTANQPALGGGSGSAPISDNITYTAQTDAATVTWAIGSLPYANATLTFTVHSGSRTLNLTNPINGGQYVIWLKQDATGGEGLTLGTGCTWKVAAGGAGAVTLSSAANAIDILAFSYDGTNCYATLTKNFS